MFLFANYKYIMIILINYYYLSISNTTWKCNFQIIFPREYHDSCDFKDSMIHDLEITDLLTFLDG